MSSSNSISQWIVGLKAGEAEAAQQLWTRYASRLIELARRRLAAAPSGAVDEEDIAQCVFGSVCRGAAAGRLKNVANRDDLWWLLLAITKRKIVDHIRRETAVKRGGGRVLCEADLPIHGRAASMPSLDQLAGSEPTAEFLAELAEQNQRLLDLLGDDRLRQVATARIEGYTPQEIAATLNTSLRAVERKLHVIRRAWAKDLIGE